jgi:Protein of unknown function (DUF2853)
VAGGRAAQISLCGCAGIPYRARGVAGCLHPTALLGVQNRDKGQVMSKRDELIAKYADDLKNKCKITPDMALLTKVTIGCGPAIYNNDSATVAGTDESELETVKKNFLMKKLGLADSPKLMEAINAVIDTYGRSERAKYRAVIYYMLTKHFGKESVYK